MNDITKPKIYIQARTANGDIKNLCPAAWAEITGKTPDRIRRDYRLRKERGFTNRQHN